MFLEAGKHVLVEYPMALSAKAAHELWEMAEEKGNMFVLKNVSSIICWVAPKTPNSGAILQPTLSSHAREYDCLRDVPV